MTKEIWAAVIIGIIQIIISIAIAWKQIDVAKAIANPETKKEKARNFPLKRITRILPSNNLFISISLIINVALIVVFIYKHGFNIFASLFIILLLLQSMILIMVSVIQHIMNRLLCHESVLFKLTDRPCKLDSVCKFKA